MIKIAIFEQKNSGFLGTGDFSQEVKEAIRIEQRCVSFGERKSYEWL